MKWAPYLLFMYLLILLILLLLSQSAAATELVYTPTNPSFGGNPLNGAFLLNQAEAQNDHKDPGLGIPGRDPLASFEESLLRRVSSNIANQIVDQTFGTGDAPLADGHYQFGDFIIDVATAGTGDVSVEIQDLGTGNSTRIEIPQFGF